MYPKTGKSALTQYSMGSPTKAKPDYQVRRNSGLMTLSTPNDGLIFLGGVFQSMCIVISPKHEEIRGLGQGPSEVRHLWYLTMKKAARNDAAMNLVLRLESMGG